MRRIAKGILWTLLFVYLLLIFLPKAGLYYLAERQLEKMHVVISGETVSEGPFSLYLKGGTLYFQSIRAARLGEVSLTTMLFYNRFAVGPFTLGEDVGTLLPPKVSGLSATHSVLMPHKIFLKGDGEFGSVDGEVDLFARRTTIRFSPTPVISSKYRAFLRYFKRTKEGYLYESAF